LVQVSFLVADGGNDIHKNLELSGEPLIPDLAKVFKLRDPDPLLKYQGLTIEGLEYEQLYSDYWNSSGDDDGEPSADHSPSVRADSAKARQFDAVIMPVAPHAAVIPGRFYHTGK